MRPELVSPQQARQNKFNICSVVLNLIKNVKSGKQILLGLNYIFPSYLNHPSNTLYMYVLKFVVVELMILK